jgi:hypothetical protein
MEIKAPSSGLRIDQIREKRNPVLWVFFAVKEQ